MGRLKTAGGIEKRANSLRITFRFEGEWCKETIRLNGVTLPPTAQNMNYATRLSKDIEIAISNGTFDYAKTFPESKRGIEERSAQQAIEVLLPESELPKNSFGALCELYLDTERNRVTKGTFATYQSAVRRWKKLLGATTPVSAIDHKVLKSKLGQTKWPSPKTFNNYLIALRGIFALEYRNSAENPCDGIENLKVPKRIPDPLKADERDMILADMKARYDTRVYAYFLWQFYTGMRPEETIALRWSDVDWNEKTVRVQRVRTFRGTEQNTTKTRVDRDVELVPQAVEALKLMKPYTFMKRITRVKDRDDSCDVFERPEFVPGPKGGAHYECAPWHDERVQRERFWIPCLKRLGIRQRRAYATRHTFCTVALMAGITPAYIAQQAGHSVQVLLEKYAKWITGADGGAARRAMAAAFADAPATDTRHAANE